MVCLLFKTSFLLGIPTLLALLLKDNDVFIGGCVCLATSLANHYYKTHELRLLDTIVVNGIGCFFVVNAFQIQSLSTILLAGLCVFLHLTNVRRSVVVHAFIHVLASIGIGAYLLDKHKMVVEN